jgi:hypothetical protein
MASKSVVPPAERISQSLNGLGAIAARLNAASDEFSKAVAPIDAALKKLNLGVTAWHRYVGSSPDQDGYYWERRIGYAKVGGKWGLALATASGYMQDPEEDGEEWLFNDAPRWIRIEAIDHVPSLLEELARQAEKTVGELQAKTSTARDLAASFGGLVDGASGRR